MKSTLVRIAFIPLLLVGVASSIVAQSETISPEKKALIADIIAVTKADKLVKDVAINVSKQMGDGYPAIVHELLKKRTDLTAQQKVEVENHILRNQDAMDKYIECILDSIDFADYTERSIYPLYDKFFTEEELKDLLQFYKSSTGQKMLAKLPELSAESMKLAQTILLPKVIEMLDRIVNEDIAAARRNVVKHPQKN